jgi:predicted heme/steroid binding protein/uncharacterized membrane protein
MDAVSPGILSPPQQRREDGMAEGKTFTREELATFNGQNGRPAYIAYKGRVIDVTGSKMWRGGMHMRLHHAGQDLSAEIEAAPHDTDVLDRYPQVGTLAEEAAPAASAVPSTSAGMPASPVGAASPAGVHASTHTDPPGVVQGLPLWLDRFLERHPFFQRHPHPMTVHFPIVFFIGAPVFTALFLITQVDGFETTALNCLGAALLFSVVVIPTGLFTWWVNYGAQPIKAVTIKLTLSFSQFIVGLVAFAWRLADPQVLRNPSGVNMLYPVLVFLLLPSILVVGWYGATLTFPLRRQKRSWKRRRDPGEIHGAARQG